VALPFLQTEITAIFSIPGRPLAEWHLGMWALVPTDAGLLRFVSILIRSWLSVQMAILLVTVTRFPDLVHAFEHLRVPSILTTIVAFLYRYLFVLVDEVMRLMRARQARSAATAQRRAGGGVLWRGRVAGNMAGQLFLRSYERSDRIYNAMLARGYDGHLRTLNPHQLHLSDWAWLFAGLACLAAFQVVGRI
jgi:cobalt/nickel transport system permease protein